MRILVFMTTEREIVDQGAAVTLKIPLLALCRCGRAFQWVLCAAFYSWGAATSHASLAPLASPHHRPGMATATTILSLLHGPESFYPFLGVLAAVACTYVLRRRRMAQLEAASTADH